LSTTVGELTTNQRRRRRVITGPPTLPTNQTSSLLRHATDHFNYIKALAADALGRAKDIAPEVAFIHAREKDCHVLLDLLAAGEIPLRVTHNDTKINNVLIDAATGKGICVIDLDTVMPGLSAYDFGDFHPHRCQRLRRGRARPEQGPL